VRPHANPIAASLDEEGWQAALFEPCAIPFGFSQVLGAELSSIREIQACRERRETSSETQVSTGLYV
jgi:hypothetical protein